MSVLSNGPFSYNRFDGVQVSDTVNSAYRSIYEKKAKPDFLDMDKDGDKKEPFKKAVNDKKKGCSDCEGDCNCDDKKDVKEGTAEFGSSAYDQASAEEEARHNRTFKGGPMRRPKGAGTGKKKEVKENREMAYGGGKPGKGSGDGSKPKGITNGKTYTMKGKDGKPLFKEELKVTKEDVIAHLIDEGFANNPVSAEVLLTHMSDEWLQSILGKG